MAPSRKPYFKKPSKFQRRAASPPAFPPHVLASLYGAPRVKVPSTPKLSLLELGGGYSPGVIHNWCDAYGYPHPTLATMGVDGASNAYTGDPQSADVEVHLDICAAIGTVYEMTGGPADITVIFAPNHDQGFLDGVTAAGALGVPCGISWGGPEDRQARLITYMDMAFAAGVQKGATFCCAAGDSGSSDGETGDHADYPGSSPYVLCCGGTSIVVQNGKIVSETPWNDQQTTGHGATGGGYSAYEPCPSWQRGFVPPGSNRGVPDVSAAADPDACAWDVAGFGGVGGTSAVAPFMAAFFAVCRAAGGSGGMPNALFYAHEAYGFRDIVAGNNGDFSAGKGWDPASGLGAPILSVLFDVLTPGATPPPDAGGGSEPTPPPTAQPPAGGAIPEAGAVKAAVDTGVLIGMHATLQLMGRIRLATPAAVLAAALPLVTKAVNAEVDAAFTGHMSP